MNFYTVVLRQSAGYWVSLCLENGIVGQGRTQDAAIEKLQAAIESLQPIDEAEVSVPQSPVAINELHEFLTMEAKEPTSEVYEFRAMYA